MLDPLEAPGIVGRSSGSDAVNCFDQARPNSRRSSVLRAVSRRDAASYYSDLTGTGDYTKRAGCNAALAKGREWPFHKDALTNNPPCIRRRALLRRTECLAPILNDAWSRRMFNCARCRLPCSVDISLINDHGTRSENERAPDSSGSRGRCNTSI
jgi:hypothetical protein